MLQLLSTIHKWLETFTLNSCHLTFLNSFIHHIPVWLTISSVSKFITLDNSCLIRSVFILFSVDYFLNCVAIRQFKNQVPKGIEISQIDPVIRSHTFMVVTKLVYLFSLPKYKLYFHSCICLYKTAVFCLSRYKLHSETCMSL